MTEMQKVSRDKCHLETKSIVIEQVSGGGNPSKENKVIG